MYVTTPLRYMCGTSHTRAIAYQTIPHTDPLHLVNHLMPARALDAQSVPLLMRLTHTRLTLALFWLVVILLAQSGHLARLVVPLELNASVQILRLNAAV